MAKRKAGDVPVVRVGEDGVIRILAMDISSTNIGIVVMDDREVREAFTYVLRGDLYQRIEQCAGWVHVLPVLGVEVLAIEGASYGAHPQAMIAQQRIAGVILGYWLARRGNLDLPAPVVEIAPSLAKVTLTGNSSATKEQMIAAAEQWSPDVGMWTEHSADALSVGLAAYTKLWGARMYLEATR